MRLSLICSRALSGAQPRAWRGETDVAEFRGRGGGHYKVLGRARFFVAAAFAAAHPAYFRNPTPSVGLRLSSAPSRATDVNRIFPHPKNLYPSPCTVTMYSGLDGFASSFWRSDATWTSTVRVTGVAS